MKQLKTNRGFTIVELLIVIVVIAILAAISIVAYNGIQNRARNTANAESASQLRTKIEAWNSIKGSYPIPAQINANLIDTDAPEAKIDGALVSAFTAQAALTTSAATAAQPGPGTTAAPINPVFAYACGSLTVPTGYVIVWRTSPADMTAVTRSVLGTCPA